MIPAVIALSFCAGVLTLPALGIVIMLAIATLPGVIQAEREAGVVVND